MTQHKFKAYSSFLKLCTECNFQQSEWFGGVYIDEDENIRILFVEGFRGNSKCEEIKRRLDNNYICEESGRYSFHFLTQLCAEILADPDSPKNGIIGAGIDVKNNRVTLAVTEDFCDKHNYSKRNEFNVEKVEWFKTNISIQPADTLSNGKCFFTAGYPAVNSENIHGVVTAGHLTDVKKDMFVFSNNNRIGSVYDYEISEDMDAAFIALENNVECSDIVSVYPNSKITDAEIEYICGSYVEMYSGQEGCVQTGTVRYPQFDFINLKNIAVFTYHTGSGDSGAPVLLSIDKEKSALAGIHLGTFFMGGTVYAYGRKIKDINEHFSLKLDIKPK